MRRYGRAALVTANHETLEGKTMDRSAPTRDNQIWHAEKLLREKGRKELERHARVSLDNKCQCGTCFCCAALFVLRRHRP